MPAGAPIGRGASPFRPRKLPVRTKGWAPLPFRPSNDARAFHGPAPFRRECRETRALRDGRGDVKAAQGRRRGRKLRRRCQRTAMPLLDLQSQLGINLDRWMLRLSSKQPFQQPSVCHTFEKEWLECSEGIGLTRAKEECRLEAEDLEECMTKRKMMQRVRAILKQRDLMIKEGKYTPPAHQND